jgi:hypothetical protein
MTYKGLCSQTAHGGSMLGMFCLLPGEAFAEPMTRERSGRRALALALAPRCTPAAMPSVGTVTPIWIGADKT